MGQALKINDRSIELNAVEPNGPLLGVEDAVRVFEEEIGSTVKHVGGGEAATKETLDWAARNLPGVLRDKYNRRLADPAKAELAMAELNQLRRGAVPMEAAEASRKAGGFTSAAEMHEARRTMSADQFNLKIIKTPESALAEIAAGRL